MLLRVYYLYEKSPKKCRELDEIVASLKQCINQSDLPGIGNRPLCGCGTRFVCHKVTALKRIIDCYGVYLTHLVSLTEDPTKKAADKQKLKGYILKWRDCKLLLGCAMFHDLLNPASILSKVLQCDELSIIDAIECILKTTWEMEQLRAANFENLPTVNKVLSRLCHNDGITYQSSELIQYEQGIAYLKYHKNGFADSIAACLKERVKLNNPGVLNDAIILLFTQGWQRSQGVDFADTALHSAVAHFTVPLQNAHVDVFLVEEEWKDMVGYAKQYLNIVEEDYPTVHMVEVVQCCIQ